MTAHHRKTPEPDLTGGPIESQVGEALDPASSAPIVVESIRRLDVKPGETLIFTVSSTLNQKDFRRVADDLQAWATEKLDSVSVLVVNSQIDLSVVARADAEFSVQLQPAEE